MTEKEYLIDWAIRHDWGVYVDDRPETGVDSAVECRSYGYRVRADFTPDGRLLAWSRNGRTQSKSLMEELREAE